MQRAAHVFVLPFLVQLGGDGFGLGVEFEHGIDGRAALIDSGDALQGGVEEGNGRDLAPRLRALQFKYALVQGIVHRVLLLVLRNRVSWRPGVWLLVLL